MHIYTHTYIHIYVYVFIQISTHVYAHIKTGKCGCRTCRKCRECCWVFVDASTPPTHTPPPTHTHTHTHTCMRTHTLTHTYMYIHMCIYTWLQVNAAAELLLWVLCHLTWFARLVHNTRRQCLIFIGLFPQRSPIIIGSFAKSDLQFTTSYASSPPCGSNVLAQLLMALCSTFPYKTQWFVYSLFDVHRPLCIGCLLCIIYLMCILCIIYLMCILCIIYLMCILHLWERDRERAARIGKCGRVYDLFDVHVIFGWSIWCA